MEKQTTKQKTNIMKRNLITSGLSLLVATAALFSAVAPAQAQDKKPNILFIMGDDIGWMQPRCYHRGLMVGETPNIDRIASEGGIFMAAYAESSCTAGRTAFFTGMTPMRAGMLMPQLPGAISYLRPGTPTLARFLYNLGYTTGQFGKNHLGDNPDSLPTAHGFQEFLGLPLSPGRHGAGELPGHQQQPHHAGHSAAVQNDSDSRSSAIR